MPIYAYRCAECGHSKDVLQKLSDPVLTTCPACGAEAFTKQVTAAGFQLKGSGWYATDFKNPAAPAAGDKAADGAAKPEGGAETKADAKADAKADTKTDAKPDAARTDPKAAASPAPAAPAAPAGGSASGT